MTILNYYGLNNFFIDNLQHSQDESKLAKVLSVHKTGYKIISSFGVKNAISKGTDVHYVSDSNIVLPKVGDFIVMDIDDVKNIGNNVLVKYILPRFNTLRRKLPINNKEQILATNLDYAFITITANLNIPFSKLERMMSAILDSNIIPIIIITKIDSINTKDLYIVENEIKNKFSSINIIKTSVNDIASIKPIKEILKNNKVAVFIGSSGTGKSTLTNLLLNKDIQKTQTINNFTNKGLHTTTSRELFLLETGGCVIDSPGIKEFALYLDSEDSLLKSFEDILELVPLCKYSTCTHTHEIGCAVLNAINNNKISQDRLNNYLKLQYEGKELFLSNNTRTKKIKNKTKSNVKKKLLNQYYQNNTFDEDD